MPSLNSSLRPAESSYLPTQTAALAPIATKSGSLADLMHITLLALDRLQSAK